MAIDRDTVIEQLKKMFDRVTDGRVEADMVSESASVTEDLGLDSLDLLEMRFEMESTWDLTVSDDEATQLRTVADVVDLVVSKAA